MQIIAGVDEVGRGPLAGPVVAAAVILDPSRKIEGLDDSKKLSEKRRIALTHEIKEKALAWCIASATIEEIDSLNILHAALLAMKRAIEGLSITPHLVRVDGNFPPKVLMPTECYVKGDSLFAEISAASIIAKTFRDDLMIEMDALYPAYGFAKHSGYPTKMHIEALQKWGACPIHRKSFAPVREVLNGSMIVSPV